MNEVNDQVAESIILSEDAITVAGNNFPLPSTIPVTTYLVRMTDSYEVGASDDGVADQVAVKRLAWLVVARSWETETMGGFSRPSREIVVTLSVFVDAVTGEFIRGVTTPGIRRHGRTSPGAPFWVFSLEKLLLRTRAEDDRSPRAASGGRSAGVPWRRA